MLKRKIKQYLEQKSEYSIFDNLLRLYISDALQNELQSWGLTHISIYIDWKSDYKLIDLKQNVVTIFMNGNLMKANVALWYILIMNQTSQRV